MCKSDMYNLHTLLCLLVWIWGKKLWVTLIPQVLCNTIPVTHKYCTHIIMATVCAGMGMVCEILTHGLPMRNPTSSKYPNRAPTTLGENLF